MSVYFGAAAPSYLLNPNAAEGSADPIPSYIPQADPAANYVGDGSYVDPASGQVVTTNAARPATQSWWESFTGGAAIDSGGNASVPNYDAQYHPSPPPERIPEAESSSGGGFLDSIASIFKSVSTGIVGVSSMVNINGQRVGPDGLPIGYRPPVQPKSSMGWVLPIAVGGAVLLAVVLLKKRRSSAPSVAGYKKRKSRKSRRSRR